MILDGYVAVLAALAVGGAILVVAGLRGTSTRPRRTDRKSVV